MILGSFSLLTGDVPDLEARLPAKHSLRRASDEAKMAVVAAAEALKGSGVPVSDRLGVYIGQHQGSLEFCVKFIEQSYREGPRLASPMYFELRPSTVPAGASGSQKIGTFLNIRFWNPRFAFDVSV